MGRRCGGRGEPLTSPSLRRKREDHGGDREPTPDNFCGNFRMGIRERWNRVKNLAGYFPGSEQKGSGEPNFVRTRGRVDLCVCVYGV